MPAISRFFGIVITMYYSDHPPPHFHVRYAGQQAVVDIQSLGLIAGTLPPRAVGLVTEWAVRYQSELLENWSRAERNEPLQPIPPLE